MVQYRWVDLIQRATGQPVRVVLTGIGSSHGMLMSSSCALNGERSSWFYAQRVKSEGVWGELKNRRGGCGYHLWADLLEQRKQGEAPVFLRDKTMRYDRAMTKRSMETVVCCHCLG
jgi:hypothetical protein